MWEHQLSPDGVTYSATNMVSSGSRIDHFFYSVEFSNSIHDIMLCEPLKDHGHRPIVMSLNAELSCHNLNNARNYSGPSIAWHKIQDVHKSNYRDKLNYLLTINRIPEDLVQCNNMACNSPDHQYHLDQWCLNVISCCLQAGLQCFPKAKKKNSLSPYWNTNIKPLKAESMFWGNIWKQCGRPTQGIVHDLYKKNKRAYHQAICQHKKSLHELQRAKLADAISTNSNRNLWSEIKKIKGKTKLIPPSVDGCTSPNDICNVFFDKYKTLYNSVPSDGQQMTILSQKIQSESMAADPCDYIISVDDVVCGIRNLKKDKHDGDLGLWSNHIILGTSLLYSHLAELLSSMVTHGYTPKALQVSTIISLIKDPTKDICSSNNFRGIALSSCINKLFDLLLLNMCSHKFETSHLQYAYKKDYSTALCTLTLKEVINYYLCGKSSVYCAFLDASKAFDRIKYDKMTQLLFERNIPAPIIRILLDGFIKQKIRTSWDNITSSTFSCSNGLRQGGVASPILFSIYFDELLKSLAHSGVGCYIGHQFAGAVAYADDMTLIAPTVQSLQAMLNVCQEFSTAYNVQFNESKTMCIKFDWNKTYKLHPVCLNGKKLRWVQSIKHLGNTLCRDLSDNTDTHLKANDLIKRANSLNVNFRFATRETVAVLFNTQCFFYGSQQWLLSGKGVDQFHTQWRKCVRQVWNLPWRARSTLLPYLMGKMPFMDQLCVRFIKMYKSIVNNKLTYLLSNHETSITARNINFVCSRWNCDRNTMYYYSTYNNIDHDSERRSYQIKELSDCIIPGFTYDEISEMRNSIATA